MTFKEDTDDVILDWDTPLLLPNPFMNTGSTLPKNFSFSSGQFSGQMIPWDQRLYVARHATFCKPASLWHWIYVFAVTSKMDMFLGQNIPIQDGQWVIFLFQAFQACHLPSLGTGRQGNPVRAAESAAMSTADVSAAFSQTEKEKRWPSDNRQLSIRWHAHTQ